MRILNISFCQILKRFISRPKQLKYNEIFFLKNYFIQWWSGGLHFWWNRIYYPIYSIRLNKFCWPIVPLIRNKLRMTIMFPMLILINNLLLMFCKPHFFWFKIIIQIHLKYVPVFLYSTLNLFMKKYHLIDYRELKRRTF